MTDILERNFDNGFKEFTELCVCWAWFNVLLSRYSQVWSKFLSKIVKLEQDRKSGPKIMHILCDLTHDVPIRWNLVANETFWMTLSAL